MMDTVCPSSRHSAQGFRHEADGHKGAVLLDVRGGIQPLLELADLHDQADHAAAPGDADGLGVPVRVSRFQFTAAARHSYTSLSGAMVRSFTRVGGTFITSGASFA
jgi:hypothetical protein